jgi:vacuolar protein sorting-associated protein 13A/C
MFEKIITDQLNTYLGSFIENVERKDLGASLFKGVVELKNLRMKQTLFDALPVPFDMVHGQIGRIYLKLPIWELFKSALVVEIENVLVIIRIKPMQNWNEAKT